MLRYIAQARAKGLGVIFITHNPHHAYPIGDHFTLLNRGRSLGTFAKSEISREELTSMMAGGEELEALSHELAEFARTDVSLVIGANDVTNPDARNKADSPIYGMPILNVDESSSVIILKRSMNSGFAGIDNPLFYDEKTAMLFGDAKASVSEITEELKVL